MVPDHKSIIVPENRLHAITTLVDEQKQMAAERILLELLPHDSEQSVKALPHIHSVHTDMTTRDLPQHEVSSC